MNRTRRVLMIDRTSACFLVLSSMILVAGCAGTNNRAAGPEIDEPTIPATTRLDYRSAPELPLAVSIAVFDYESPERSLTPIREAESGYMAVTLANALQNSGQWSGVHVLPVTSQYAEVQLRGSIVQSNASRLNVLVEVIDARGEVWISRQYRASVAGDAYSPGVPPETEVFAHLYHQIANDLTEIQHKLAPSDRSEIRQVALMRYAVGLAPDAFSSYLGMTESQDGVRFGLTGLPALDDPVFLQVGEILAREDSIVELIDTQYRQFHRDLLGVYPYWRRYLHELSAETETRRRSSGGSWAATEAVYRQYEEVRLNEDRLRVLTRSFKDESQSTSAELAGTVVELSGSLAQQYLRWRELLQRRFREDRGLPADIDTAR
ncbi:MAG: hypothetical protein CBC10_007140 [Gammaproteobacteria bacterium TMED50]|nr:MAG: hypothetical protein CBC10_007140 [Gammaproteobacteria bacterium TMED50]